MLEGDTGTKYVLDRGGSSSPSGLTSSGSKTSLSRFFKGLSTSAKRAAATATEIVDAQTGAYKDLEGEAPETRLEKVEKKLDEEQSEASFSYTQRASRFLFSGQQASSASSEKKADENERSSTASSVVLGGRDIYLPMADNEQTLEERKATASSGPTATLVSSVSRASDMVFASLRPHPKNIIQEARHSALPYIDSVDYTNQALRKPLAAEPAAVVAARIQAQANKSGSDTHGGLWALKAKIVTLDKDISNAQAVLKDAEIQAKEQLDALRTAEHRRDQLKLREARLRALLEQARLLEAQEGHSKS